MTRILKNGLLASFCWLCYHFIFSMLAIVFGSAITEYGFASLLSMLDDYDAEPSGKKEILLLFSAFLLLVILGLVVLYFVGKHGLHRITNTALDFLSLLLFYPLILGLNYFWMGTDFFSLATWFFSICQNTVFAYHDVTRQIGTVFDSTLFRVFETCADSFLANAVLFLVPYIAMFIGMQRRQPDSKRENSPAATIPES